MTTARLHELARECADQIFAQIQYGAPTRELFEVMVTSTLSEACAEAVLDATRPKETPAAHAVEHLMSEHCRECPYVQDAVSETISRLKEVSAPSKCDDTPGPDSAGERQGPGDFDGNPEPTADRSYNE